MVQFRVTNKGQTSAHDITVSWARPLYAVCGEKTQYELQRFPAALKKIATEVAALRTELQQNRKPSDGSA